MPTRTVTRNLLCRWDTVASGAARSARPRSAETLSVPGVPGPGPGDVMERPPSKGPRRAGDLLHRPPFRAPRRAGDLLERPPFRGPRRAGDLLERPPFRG